MNTFEEMEKAWEEMQEEMGVNFSEGVIEVLGDDVAEKIITEFEKSNSEGRACLIRQTRNLLNERAGRAEVQALDVVEHTNRRKTEAAQKNLNAVRRFCNLTVNDFCDAVGVSPSFFYGDQLGKKPILSAAANLGLHPTLINADNRTLASLADIAGRTLDFTLESMENLLTHNDGKNQTQYSPDVWAAKIIDTGYNICNGMPPMLAAPAIVIGRHRAGRSGAKFMFSLRNKMSKDVSGECEVPNIIERRIHRRFRKSIQ